MSSYYDDLVNDFLLHQWECEVRGRYADLSVINFTPLSHQDEAHLVTCDSTRFQMSHEPRWECDCYSEVTRDDVFEMNGDIFCDHGTTVSVEFRSYFESHDVLQHLAAFEDTRDCPYMDEDE